MKKKDDEGKRKISGKKKKRGKAKVKEEEKFTAIMLIAGLNPFFMNKTEIMDFYNNSIYYKLHFEDAKDLKNFELAGEFGEVKVFKVV